MTDRMVTRLARVGVAACLLVAAAPFASATCDNDVQTHLTNMVDAGKPIVVHVVVALCDNENQGIVPVKEHLGNGQDPRSNLYWGALYGVRTHLSRVGGWQRVASGKPEDDRVLDRVVLHQRLVRGEKEAPVYLVADAWDGEYIRAAIERFLEMTAGRAAETVEVTSGSTDGVELEAGGSASLVVYVGHNGLMDFSLRAREGMVEDIRPRSSIVLACESKDYFLDHLRVGGSHPLLLTTGLMAPEAYTLDSAIRVWVAGDSAEAVREAAAQAYDKYQGCGATAARQLFWSAE